MINTPAFPLNELSLTTGEVVDQHFGMTLRDYFATNAPNDEVQELDFRHLSRMAREVITGLKYPARPENERDSASLVAFQLAELDFKCAVNSAIRFKLADAMMAARGQQ